MSHTKQRRYLSVATTLVVAVALALTGCSSSSSPGGSSSVKAAKSGDYTIALSNSFIGNTWRQTMVKAFEASAADAKKKGLIKGFSVANSSQGTATEQIAQIQSLILKKPSAILIDSASPTALNPVIQQACNAGIKVVVFDSLASAKCEYDVVNNMVDYGFQEATLVAKAMDGHGNMLVLRGVTGSLPDKLIHEGQMKALKKYPNIKVVKTLVGQDNDSIAQQVTASAIPSLPTIDGAVAQGAGNGVLLAYKDAGLPLPHVAFGTSGTALRHWQALIKSQEYKGGALLTDPGQGSAAVWVALAILNGQKVPKTTTLPILVITQPNLDAWIKVTPPDQEAAWVWSQEQANAAIKTNLKGGQVAPLPTPASSL